MTMQMRVQRALFHHPTLRAAHTTAMFSQSAAADGRLFESPLAPTLIGQSDDMAGCRLAIMPASFNPPTRAHLALARATLSTGQADRMLFVFSQVAVNKESVTRALLLDRLIALALCQPTTTPRARGILVVNRGLFVDIIDIAWALYPRLGELVVVAGFDKFIQLLDPKYYVDYDAAQRRLFARCRILVAPRAGATPRVIAQIMADGPQARFADRVAPLAVSTRLAHLSATDARLDLALGGNATRLVTEPVRIFAHQTGAYDDPTRVSIDRYGLRMAFLSAIMEQTNLPDDLLPIWQRLWYATPSADRCRALLASSHPGDWHEGVRGLLAEH